MALFNSESKEEKKARQTEEMLEKFGLHNLSDPRDIQAVRTIAAGLTGSSWITAGTALAGTPQDVAKMTLLRAIVEQNFILIRQLDRLANK